VTVDPVVELRFALLEVDDGPLPVSLRQRIQAASVKRRRPGASVEANQAIPGKEVFARAAERLGTFLSALSPAERGRITIRGSMSSNCSAI
jgi:hypothetical protein